MATPYPGVRDTSPNPQDGDEKIEASDRSMSSLALPSGRHKGRCQSERRVAGALRLQAGQRLRLAAFRDAPVVPNPIGTFDPDSESKYRAPARGGSMNDVSISGGVARAGGPRQVGRASMGSSWFSSFLRATTSCSGRSSCQCPEEDAAQVDALVRVGPVRTCVRRPGNWRSSFLLPTSVLHVPKSTKITIARRARTRGVPSGPVN